MANERDWRIGIKPARGTRPANRRELILAAAEDLFYRNGFANVGMGDIAEAVAIGPSALYRHFGSKHELLATVVVDALDSTEKMLAASDPRPRQLAANISREMLEHRAVGVLWRREARNLAQETRTAVRNRVRDIGSQLARMITTARPEVGPAQADLLGWCVLAVATSISFHPLKLPDRQFAGLLTELVATVIDFDMPGLIAAPTGEASPTTVPSGASRREVLLTTAAKLFADRGFSNVGIEDIGAAVGIAGPSIYNHFDSKADMLVAIMMRGDSWLRMDMSRALGRADGPADGLRRLLGSYTDFAFEFPDLVQLLMTEIVQLPDDQQHRMRTAQHDYIVQWVHLLRSLHPGLDTTNARIRVQAALNMINDIALTPHLHRYQNLAPSLIDIGANLLDERI